MKRIFDACKHLFRRQKARRAYTARIVAAGQTVSVVIDAPDMERARIEAADIARGGVLIDCRPS